MQPATAIATDFHRAVRPAPPPKFEPFRRCRACDVTWVGDSTCWVCGIDVKFQLAPWQTPVSACVECGNDDPCEGYKLCSDCLETHGT